MNVSTIPSSLITIGVRTRGGAPFSGFFNGLIDEVEIYNRALSTAEIQETMGRCLNGNVAITQIGDLIARIQSFNLPQGIASLLNYRVPASRLRTGMSPLPGIN